MIRSELAKKYITNGVLKITIKCPLACLPIIALHTFEKNSKDFSVLELQKEIGMQFRIRRTKNTKYDGNWLCLIIN